MISVRLEQHSGAFRCISRNQSGHFKWKKIKEERKKRERGHLHAPIQLHKNVWQLPQRRGSRRWPWQRGAAPWGTRDASSWSALRSCAWVWLMHPHALWPAACTSSTWTWHRCRRQSRGRQTWCMSRSASACVEGGRNEEKVHGFNDMWLKNRHISTRRVDLLVLDDVFAGRSNDVASWSGHDGLNRWHKPGSRGLNTRF